MWTALVLAAAGPPRPSDGRLPLTPQSPQSPPPAVGAGVGQPISSHGAAAASVTLTGAPYDASLVPAWVPLHPPSADGGGVLSTPASPLLLLLPATTKKPPARLEFAAMGGAAALGALPPAAAAAAVFDALAALPVSALFPASPAASAAAAAAFVPPPVVRSVYAARTAYGLASEWGEGWGKSNRPRRRVKGVERGRGGLPRGRGSADTAVTAT